MTENMETLELSLQQYELQLQQVAEAISNSDEVPEELCSLKENLEELIMLTKESLNSRRSEIEDDPLSREYELFKAELGDVPSETYNENNQSEESIEDELNCLIGSKCQAPFSEQWAEKVSYTYHNALVMSIDSADSLDNIKVKVIFVNPTCKEMIPCQYFLSGECKFSIDQCHFSHGYVVNFSDLREYKEPDFNLLKENVSVLAKDFDNLWKRAVITALILEENQCTVKFESGRKEEVILDIHNTLPLTDCSEVFTGSSGCDIRLSKKTKMDNSHIQSRHDVLIEQSLRLSPSDKKLGEWEQYTNSIGSKLMAKMGYVVGTGLGKLGEGRVEPVTAAVLPKGKSLDHCMALREAADGDPNLFTVDRLQKKLQKRVNARKRKAGTRQKTEKKLDSVFSFLNNSLSDPSAGISKCEDDSNFLLKQSSSQALNVEELKISENIERNCLELMVLRDKLSKQKTNTVGHNTLKKQVQQAENKLQLMRSKLKDVHKEKSYRQTMKELAEF